MSCSTRTTVLPSSSAARRSSRIIVDRVPHVEVVERLVEQHVVGVLAEHHGDEGPLALAARQLVEEAVGQLVEVDVADRALDELGVRGRQAALRIGIAAEARRGRAR